MRDWKGVDNLKGEVNYCRAAKAQDASRDDRDFEPVLAE